MFRLTIFIFSYYYILGSSPSGWDYRLISVGIGSQTQWMPCPFHGTRRISPLSLFQKQLFFVLASRVILGLSQRQMDWLLASKFLEAMNLFSFIALPSHLQSLKVSDSDKVWGFMPVLQQHLICFCMSVLLIVLSGLHHDQVYLVQCFCVCGSFLSKMDKLWLRNV